MILKISKMKRKLSHFNNSTFLVKVERIKKEISLLFFFFISGWYDGIDTEKSDKFWKFK